MNIHIKRILCLVLVVCLLLTLPGCTSAGDLVGAVWHLARRLTYLLSYVVIIPAMWVVDQVTWPFVEYTGFNVNALGNRICQSWTELILPEGLMDNGWWGGWFVIRDEEELEAKLRKGGHLKDGETLDEKILEEVLGPTEPAEEETGPAEETVISDPDKFYADNTPEETTYTFTGEGTTGIPKGDKTNAWGELINCPHMPHKYDEKTNAIYCKCKANAFYGQDLADWSYEDFAECLGAKHKFLKSIRYKTDLFLVFQGLDKGFLDLLEIGEFDKDYAVALQKLEQVTTFFENVSTADSWYRDYAKTPDEIDALKDFDETFEVSLLVVQSLVDMRQMLDEKQEPNKATNLFIKAVSVPIKKVSKTTSRMGVLTMGLLKVLPTSYSAYKIAEKLHMDDVQFADLSRHEANRAMTSVWMDIRYGETYWGGKLNLSRILGIEKMPEQVKLPNLKEIMNEYQYLTPEGKAFADRYILWCLDYIFQDIMGVTYEQYLNCVGGVK